jgi:hypothetical protein
MSVDFLVGLLATKQKDFDVLKEVLDDSLGNFSLRETDKRIRELISKRFSLKEQRLDFLKKDIDFHQKAIRSQKEREDSIFLQAIFLVYDFYNFELMKKNQPIQIAMGYASLEEIKKIIQKKEQNNLFSLPELLIEHLLTEKKDFISQKEIFNFRLKVLLARKFDFINYYLELESDFQNYEFDKIKKRIPFDLLKILKSEDFYELELFRFYLPFLLTRKRYFSNPYEFIFVYFQKRFCFWKIIEPYLI